MASSTDPFGNGSAPVNDDFDMSEYVNFEQSFHNSPSPTSVKIEPHNSLDPRDILLNGPAQQRQQYNGPSHNYDQFQQQTGLPSGSISHVHAVNQFSNSNHVRPTDFGAVQLANYNTGFELAYDGQGSSDANNLFVTNDNTDDYAIDPSTLVDGTQPPSSFRAWPGMHSQQAKEQAQAQAEAKQQQHDEALRSQQPLPSNFEQTFDGRSRSQTNASEPRVNEQISRLLTQMRQNSTASQDDLEEGRGSLTGTSASHLRRGEDDMDEDERLLASEEGKKLSSKERRQLRNKVSARAFRSRRKEYITQLEGEVAAKNNKCNEFKVTNRHLLEQNRQLTQLCKAMLNHPSFGTFMEDISSDPSILNTLAPQSTSSANNSQRSQQSQQSSNKLEQSQTSQAPPPQQQNIQVGMAMIPESNLDFSMLNLGASHWQGAHYQQPQIFALHEVPSGPSLERLQTRLLSDKVVRAPEEADDVGKVTTPTVKNVPVPFITEPEAPSSTAELDLEDIKDDPNFALYVNSAPVNTNSPLGLTTVLTQLEQSLSEKSASYFHLHVHSWEDEAQCVRAVDRFFARSEGVLRRIDAAAHHVPR